MELTQTEVFSRARPIRIAFFVDLGESSHEILDAVFQYAFSIWGGRFSLIVPFIDGAPVPEYLPWLEAYDADIIYSYVALSSEQQTALHEKLYPSELIGHSRNEMAGHPIYRPNITVTPLSVGTVLPMAGAPSQLDGRRGVQVIGAIGSMAEDRFLADSFGFVSPLLRNQLDGVLSDIGSILDVCDEPRPQYLRHYTQQREVIAKDAVAALNTMSNSNRIKGVAQLSAMLADRLNLHSHRWSESFNVVIGKTVPDRVLYWNARALLPAWMDGSDVDMFIPEEKLDNADFVDAVRKFIHRRNAINGPNVGGQPVATLRSISVEDERLASLATTLQGDRSWVTYGHENVGSIKACIPDARTLTQAHARAAWSRSSAQSYSIGEKLRITPPEPDHLRHVPTTMVSPETGLWAVELDIKRSKNHAKASNVHHSWWLPRRLRVTQAFCKGYTLGRRHNPLVEPRVSKYGLLTLFADTSRILPEINLPNDQEAITTGLMQGMDWLPFDRRNHREDLPQRCFAAIRSSAGRHFWGVYQLFGNLSSAQAMLLHEFWRTQLSLYGATDQKLEERRGKIEATLRKRFRKALDLNQDDQLHRLSDVVLREANELRAPVRSIEWTDFEESFGELIERQLKSQPIPADAEISEQDERDQYLKNLGDHVQSLCKLGVLRQGYEHKCKRCLHRSWISINDLKSDMTCEVCRDSQPAPVDAPWQFRLDGFLREALRSHGIAPLFWTLARLHRRDLVSFWFEGPLDVYSNAATYDARQRETDIDLTVVSNGIVRMCEVKQSERAFLDPDGLAKVMRKLRPDIAVVAVMEELTPSLTKKFQRFESALSDSGIGAELLTLDEEHDIVHQPLFFY